MRNIQHIDTYIRIKLYEYNRHLDYTCGLYLGSNGRMRSMLARDFPRIGLRNKHEWVAFGATNGRHGFKFHA